MGECLLPRCTEPSVGDTPARWWGQCYRHAVEYADAQLERAQAERDSLRPFATDLFGGLMEESR